jgi:AcrR family transcriptional regulator
MHQLRSSTTEQVPPVVIPKPARGRPRDDELAARRKEDILAVATRLFAEHGYRTLDVQLIADELGIGKGTIYRHFGTKRDLFKAAIERGIRRLNERTGGAIAPDRDPLEALRDGMRHYLEFFAENPTLVELFVQERAEFRDNAVPTYFLRHDENTKCWVELIEKLRSSGRIRNVQPERVIQVFGDLLYGTIFSNYLGRRDASPAQQAEHIVDIAFFGLLADEERAARQQASA